MNSKKLVVVMVITIVMMLCTGVLVFDASQLNVFIPYIIPLFYNDLLKWRNPFDEGNGT